MGVRVRRTIWLCALLVLIYTLTAGAVNSEDFRKGTASRRIVKAASMVSADKNVPLKGQNTGDKEEDTVELKGQTDGKPEGQTQDDDEEEEEDSDSEDGDGDGEGDGKEEEPDTDTDTDTEEHRTIEKKGKYYCKVDKDGKQTMMLCAHKGVCCHNKYCCQEGYSCGDEGKCVRGAAKQAAVKPQKDNEDEDNKNLPTEKRVVNLLKECRAKFDFSKREGASKNWDSANKALAAAQQLSDKAVELAESALKGQKDLTAAAKAVLRDSIAKIHTLQDQLDDYEDVVTKKTEEGRDALKEQKSEAAGKGLTGKKLQEKQQTDVAKKEGLQEQVEKDTKKAKEAKEQLDKLEKKEEEKEEGLKEEAAAAEAKAVKKEQAEEAVEEEKEEKALKKSEEKEAQDLEDAKDGDAEEVEAKAEEEADKDGSHKKDGMSVFMWNKNRIYKGHKPKKKQEEGAVADLASELDTVEQELTKAKEDVQAGRYDRAKEGAETAAQKIKEVIAKLEGAMDEAKGTERTRLANLGKRIEELQNKQQSLSKDVVKKKQFMKELHQVESQLKRARHKADGDGKTSALADLKGVNSKLEALKESLNGMLDDVEGRELQRLEQAKQDIKDMLKETEGLQVRVKQDIEKDAKAEKDKDKEETAAGEGKGGSSSDSDSDSDSDSSDANEEREQKAAAEGGKGNAADDEPEGKQGADGKTQNKDDDDDDDKDDDVKGKARSAEELAAMLKKVRSVLEEGAKLALKGKFKDAKAKADEAKKAFKQLAADIKATEESGKEKSKEKMEALKKEALKMQGGLVKLLGGLKGKVKGKADELKGKAEDAKDKLKDKAEELKGKAEEAKDKLKGKADELKGKADELKGKAEEIKGKVEGVKDKIEEGKKKAGELLKKGLGVALAPHKALGGLLKKKWKKFR